MPGLLEAIMEKMDTLTVALNENTKVRLAGGDTPTTAAAATEEKPKRTKKTEEAPVNKVSEQDLVAKFDSLKSPENMARLKKIIAETGGVASLAELRQVPAKFDSVFAELEKLEAETAASTSDDDDL